ncbi:nuclear transport factor 2 family protein [Lacisediminihabitans sp. FW035]
MTAVDISDLPGIVMSYLTASQGTDPGSAVALFTADATVTDSGSHYAGTVEILDFLERATTEFEYTSTLIGAERAGNTATAINRLEGNFPGGIVELRYVFSLDDGETAITRLSIS